MSSAKRTPRYVDAIRPYEVVERTMSADIIRLRPELGPALPPITEHWPRARAVPLARRPWQLLLVPPTPGAPTRTFNVARWHARLVLVVASALLVVAVAGVATLVVAVRTPEVFTSEETEQLRSRLLVLEDSLALALTAHASAADSLALAARNVAAAPAPAARRTPRLLAPGLRPSRRADRATDAPSVGIEGLPVIGAIASRFSRARRHPLLKVVRPHLGVDVAARRGTEITAPAPGRVSFVGRKFGFGLVIEIDHGNGVVTRYAHCGSSLVNAGARVERGVPIATVGTSGLASGPHLHYEVLVRGRQVDPLRYKLTQPATDSSVAPTPAPAPASPVTAPTAPASFAAPPRAEPQPVTPHP
ncbi:MAG TPA: M23 family metallopeptidase [Gemmatimonadaceae bacterium]|nr:M23 family metallopeptidase [Gemmatimonadaceae bacterium]